MRPVAVLVLTVLLMLAAVPEAQSSMETTMALGQSAAFDEAPAADATEAQSSPLIWLIPLAMGLFGLGLAFAIRRFSRPERQPKAQDEIKKPGSQG